MKSMMAYNPLVKPLCSPKETGFRTWDCRTLSSKVKEVKSTMKPFDWLESNIDYGRNLVNSGVEGALSARQKSLGEAPVSSVLIEAVRQAWMPAAVGAYVGSLGATLGNRRKPNYGAIVGAGLLGAAIGVVTGMAWGTRRLTGDMARGAMRKIDATRDAHWLEKNPIPYG